MTLGSVELQVQLAGVATRRKPVQLVEAVFSLARLHRPAANENTMMSKFPGPLYLLSLDPKKTTPGESTYRVVHAHVGGKKYVAIFSDEPRAIAWAKDNLPTNEVLRPFALPNKAEVLLFLNSLIAQGETHVCFNPDKQIAGMLEIRQFIGIVENIA